MHYVYIAAVPEGGSLDDILAPYNDDADMTAVHAKNPSHLRWDWWVDGGRWTGCFFKNEDDSGVKSQLTDRVPYGFIDEYGIPWCKEPYWGDRKYPDCFEEDAEYDAKWLAFLIRIPEDMQLVCVDFHD